MTHASLAFANPIIAAGVAGLCDLYADRAVTPVEATESYLSRIAGLDNALNAYVHVDAEGATAAAHASAERWRRGEALSRLDGVPVALKANIAVEGWPWHAGVAAYRDRLAPRDAALVARLRAAGAVLLGLTGMFEGAFGASGENPHFGRVHNPWDFEVSTGGSSGGAGAAVAAGLCAGAIGTDTLGSIRLPAAFCGVVGHKPTPGLVPTDGVTPMAWTLDHAGPLARSPDDVARLFGALCADDPDLARDLAEPAGPGALAELPLALLDFGLPLDVLTQAAVDMALSSAAAAGLTVERVRPAGIDVAAMLRLGAFVSAAESMAEHADALTARPEGFSPGYRALLQQLSAGSAPDLARAYRELAQAGEAVREALSPYAGALLPVSPVARFPADGLPPLEVPMLTAPANVAGLAATAFPVGIGANGLPLSVQAWGWDDETTLGLAKLLARDPGAPPAYRG